MCKKLKITLLTILFLIIPYFCVAFPKIDVDKLINNPKPYTNKDVIIEGEVIGEPMIRGDKVWINVNDGTCAIGVWGDKDIVNKIKTYGNYHYKGDKIRVQGQFHYNCKEHGGDVDIHYEKINILKSGEEISRRLDIKKIVFTVILLCITGILSIIYFVNKKKPKL